jgi:hypothetical protein
VAPGSIAKHYQFLLDVVGLEGVPLNILSIIQVLLDWKSSGSGLENRY